MRIRTIRPEFWSDERVADLDDLSKLVYIGTWNLADDSGFFRWSIRAIAGELFRYERPDRRERKVERALDVLRAGDRLRILECGRHAIIPKFHRHQHLAGSTRQVHTIRREHDAECVSAAPRGDGREPADPRDVEESRGIGRGEVSKEEIARERANGREAEIAVEELWKLYRDPKTAPAARRVAERQLVKLGEKEGESDG